MKIRFFLVILFVVIISVSCNKSDNFNYPPGTVGISKIIYFPIISIKGDRFISIVQGSTYTDPGVNATLNGQSTTYTTSATVDASTPGIYTLIYTAVNSEGYSASDWRMVIVTPSGLDADPVVSANDFSGTYLRPATGITSTWTKLATGVYLVENPGGSTGVGKHAVVVNYSGYTITMPSQNDPDFGGIVSTSNETYTPTPAPATYSWKFFAIGYGTGLRTFIKQ